MKDALSNMRRVTVELDGQRASLVLRIVPVGAELPLLENSSALTDAGKTNRLRLLIQGLIESLDGAPLTRDRAGALAAHPHSAAALLKLRADTYEDERMHGRILLACPHCAHESELTLVALALALGPNPWPVAGTLGELVEPSLSSLHRLGARPPGSTHAAGARLLLPSARRGLAGPFSEAHLGPAVTPPLDAAAWQRWVLADRPFTPERAHWSFGNPGFRAILRATIAVADLDGTRDLAPDTIERLPMTDFLFIDAAYHLLRHIDVPDAERASVTCPRCSQRLLLVL